nr:13458_t:CDS:2 [Entrophospora candida]
MNSNKTESSSSRQELDSNYEIINHFQGNYEIINHFQGNYEDPNNSSTEYLPINNLSDLSSYDSYSTHSSTPTDSSELLSSSFIGHDEGKTWIDQQVYGNREQISLSSFHVAYLGESVNKHCKDNIFSKLSASLGKYFSHNEEEVEDEESDVKEKRHILYPQGNDYHIDTKVSLCVLDLTNKPLSDAKDNLLKNYLKVKSGDGNDRKRKVKSTTTCKRINRRWIDLCVIFLPSKFSKIPSVHIPIMLELHKYVTLFPVICSVDPETGLECVVEGDRKKLLKYFLYKKIGLFIWNDDIVNDKGLASDVSTTQVMLDKEFSKLDDECVYYDMQILRSQAIKLKQKYQSKNDSANREGFLKTKEKFIIKATVVMFIAYFTLFILTSLSQLNFESDNNNIENNDTSVDKLYDLVFGKQYFGYNHNNNHVSYRGSSEYVEVWQMSNNRFLFDIINANYANYEGFEVILHYGNETSIKKNVDMIDENQYYFDLDYKEIVGINEDLLIEIIDRNGTIMKAFSYFPINVAHEEEKEVLITNDNYEDYGEFLKNEYFGFIDKDGSDSLAIDTIYKRMNQVVNRAVEEYHVVAKHVKEIVNKIAEVSQETFNYVFEAISHWLPIIYENVKSFVEVEEKIDDDEAIIYENVESFMEEKIDDDEDEVWAIYCEG